MIQSWASVAGLGRGCYAANHHDGRRSDATAPREHHAQFGERRQIHSITERTAAGPTVLAGWVALSEASPPVVLRVVLAVVVGGIAAAAIRSLRTNERAYLEAARVVRKLNEVLGVYEVGRFVSGEALYPKRWRTFGDARPWSTILHHCAAIVLLAVASVTAIFAKP